MRKGGVAGGVKNARFSGKTQFKAVKRGLFRAHFGPNRASLGAFESESREFERECDQIGPLRIDNANLDATPNAKWRFFCSVQGER